MLVICPIGQMNIISQINQTEPHTPSYNMGEGDVRELKKVYGKKCCALDAPNGVGMTAYPGNHM
jgi:hypothetical protein